MPTYRITIEYNGTAFCGWQRQPDLLTIQGQLEIAAETIFRQPIQIQGAGRTDSGVHALGQVASFEAPHPIDPKHLRRGLTALAGPDISVIEAALAPDRFNARFDAQGKHYRYQLIARRSPSPLHALYSHHVPAPLDLERMATAAAMLIGEHDFAGFRAADCGRENTVRELSQVTVSAQGTLIAIDVKGTAFLKNMVRIIAGTLIDVSRGRLEPETISRGFESKDRRFAGITAPAKGLTLVEVFYPEGWLRPKPGSAKKKITD